jgi:hypothetical protein
MLSQDKCVCMYACVYVCMYVRMHVLVLWISVYVCMHVCMCVRTYVAVLQGLHAQSVCLFVCVCVCACTYAYSHVTNMTPLQHDIFAKEKSEALDLTLPQVCVYVACMHTYINTCMHERKK